MTKKDDANRAFSRFAPFIRNYIYRCDWSELRRVQIEAATCIFDDTCNLLISSQTASGKTEAAFFPILSLMEKEDGSCRYYDADTRYCQIQSVKPKQCRDFPFHWKFKGWEKLCAGGARLVELQKKKKNNNQKSEQEI